MHWKLAIYLSLMALTGCVTTGTTPSKQSSKAFSEMVQSLPEPPPGKVHVVAYRKTTGGAGLFLDAVVKNNGETVFAVGNGDFAVTQLPVGPHELEVSFVNLYGLKCQKSFFLTPSQITFLKLGDREPDPSLGIPIVGIVKEINKQNKEKCAGFVEAYVVDQATALADN